MIDAVNQYSTAFIDLVVRVSVDSEDVYRTTDIGMASNVGPGATPDTLVGYVNQVRSAISSTALACKAIGHVDTCNTWTNTTYTAGLIDTVDFLGVDAYPYYESTKSNSINNSRTLFWDDFDDVVGAAHGKPVWVTGTGWPVQRATINEATVGLVNAATYFQQTACSLFHNGVNTWRFNFQDRQQVVPPAGVVFAVTGLGLPPPTTPLYSMLC